jgi:hypothetical protein
MTVWQALLFVAIYAPFSIGLSYLPLNWGQSLVLKIAFAVALWGCFYAWALWKDRK